MLVDQVNGFSTSHQRMTVNHEYEFDRSFVWLTSANHLDFIQKLSQSNSTSDMNLLYKLMRNQRLAKGMQVEDGDYKTSLEYRILAKPMISNKFRAFLILSLYEKYNHLSESNARYIEWAIRWPKTTAIAAQVVARRLHDSKNADELNKFIKALFHIVDLPYDGNNPHIYEYDVFHFKALSRLFSYCSDEQQNRLLCRIKEKINNSRYAVNLGVIRAARIICLNHQLKPEQYDIILDIAFSLIDQRKTKYTELHQYIILTGLIISQLNETQKQKAIKHFIETLKLNQDNFKPNELAWKEVISQMDAEQQQEAMEVLISQVDSNAENAGYISENVERSVPFLHSGAKEWLLNSLHNQLTKENAHNHRWFLQIYFNNQSSFAPDEAENFMQKLWQKAFNKEKIPVIQHYELILRMVFNFKIPDSMANMLIEHMLGHESVKRKIREDYTVLRYLVENNTLTSNNIHNLVTFFCNNLPAYNGRIRNDTYHAQATSLALLMSQPKLQDSDAKEIFTALMLEMSKEPQNLSVRDVCKAILLISKKNILPDNVDAKKAYMDAIKKYKQNVDSKNDSFSKNGISCELNKMAKTGEFDNQDIATMLLDYAKDFGAEYAVQALKGLLFLIEAKLVSNEVKLAVINLLLNDHFAMHSYLPSCSSVINYRIKALLLLESGELELKQKVAQKILSNAYDAIPSILSAYHLIPFTDSQNAILADICKNLIVNSKHSLNKTGAFPWSGEQLMSTINLLVLTFPRLSAEQQKSITKQIQALKRPDKPNSPTINACITLLHLYPYLTKDNQRFLEPHIQNVNMASIAVAWAHVGGKVQAEPKGVLLHYQLQTNRLPTSVRSQMSSLSIKDNTTEDTHTDKINKEKSRRKDKSTGKEKSKRKEKKVKKEKKAKKK